MKLPLIRQKKIEEPQKRKYEKRNIENRTLAELKSMHTTLREIKEILNNMWRERTPQ